MSGEEVTMKYKDIIQNTTTYFLLFFVFYFLYLFLIFDTSIYYHLHQSAFLFNKTYFFEFLQYPGGLIEWVSQFLLQFLFLRLSGALLLSLLLLSILLISYNLIEKIVHSNFSFILAYLPVGLLMFIQNHYNFPLNIPVKYLIMLIFTSLYLKISDRYRWTLILLSFLLYYLMGGLAYLSFVLLCILCELLFSKNKIKYINSGLLLGFYFLYPFITARIIFTITLKEAYLYVIPAKYLLEPFQFRSEISLILLFILLPLLTIILFLSKRFKWKATHPLLIKRSSIGTQSISIILIGILILSLSFDKIEKKKIQVDSLAEQEKWQELLICASEIQDYDRLVNFNVNRALYHTGQLLDNLFTWPQLLGTDGLFIDKYIASQIALPASDLYFDLGHIMASQVMAYEGQTKFKYHPRILKRLAMTNIINKQYKAASKFLDLLERTLLYKKWAKHYKNYIADTSLMESDRLIQLKRHQQPKSDFFIHNKNPNVDLVQLLIENPTNKMAFEYLIAYYLLDCKLGNVMKHLDKAKHFNYKKFPRHIEEALLFTRLAFPDKINIGKIPISSYTMNRFNRLNTILIQNVNNDPKAKELLEKEDFHNTLWYYIRYVNPMRTKLEMKVRKIDERLF